MGIVEYLKKKKKSGQSWKRDNIELLRPVVNIFLGEFVGFVWGIKKLP